MKEEGPLRKRMKEQKWRNKRATPLCHVETDMAEKLRRHAPKGMVSVQTQARYKINAFKTRKMSKAKFRRHTM